MKNPEQSSQSEPTQEELDAKELKLNRMARLRKKAIESAKKDIEKHKTQTVETPVKPEVVKITTIEPETLSDESVFDPEKTVLGGPEKKSKSEKKEIEEVEKTTEVREKKEVKRPEGISLSEKLDEIEKNPEQLERFAEQLKGRKVYHFVDGKRQYVTLDDIQKIDDKWQATLVFYENNGEEIKRKENYNIGKTKYKEWKKELPEKDEESVFLRGDNGKYGKGNIKKLILPKKEDKYLLENKKGKPIEILSADEIIKYQGEDGVVAYSRSTLPRPELSQVLLKASEKIEALAPKIGKEGIEIEADEIEAKTKIEPSAGRKEEDEQETERLSKELKEGFDLIVEDEPVKSPEEEIGEAEEDQTIRGSFKEAGKEVAKVVTKDFWSDAWQNAKAYVKENWSWNPLNWLKEPTYKYLEKSEEEKNEEFVQETKKEQLLEVLNIVGISSDATPEEIDEKIQDYYFDESKEKSPDYYKVALMFNELAYPNEKDGDFNSYEERIPLIEEILKEKSDFPIESPEQKELAEKIVIDKIEKYFMETAERIGDSNADQDTKNSWSEALHKIDEGINKMKERQKSGSKNLGKYYKIFREDLNNLNEKINRASEKKEEGELKLEEFEYACEALGLPKNASVEQFYNAAVGRRPNLDAMHSGKSIEASLEILSTNLADDRDSLIKESKRGEKSEQKVKYKIHQILERVNFKDRMVEKFKK